MLTLAQLRIAFMAELQDHASFLSLDEIETHIERAIRSVNLDKPFRTVSDIAGDGSSDYALPTSYLKGYSVIERVEAPANEDPPRYLREEDDWFVYENPTQPAGQQMRLRFRLSNPQTGDVIRLIHTAFYTVTETSSDLDPYAFEAVLARALMNAYTALAARFSQSQDPTILADSVNYGQRVQSFLFLRERAKTEYQRRTGLGSPVKAAQYLTEVDLVHPSGEDFVWHPRLLR